MKGVVVIGSLNMDLVTELKVTPKVGETVLGGNIVKIPGGKGANQCAAIAKLGGKVSMIGCVGNDKNGKILIESLENFGANTGYIKIDNSVDTGIAFIMINASGDNSIVVVPGANFTLGRDDISIDKMKDCDYLVSQFEVAIETVKEGFRLSKSLGMKNILNPAPAREIDDELIGLTDIIIPNETELEIITGIKVSSIEDIDRGARFLIDKGVKEVIVTLGKEGSKYYSREESFKIEGKIVEVVDTTAAGDSYIGGLVYSLSTGKGIRESMEYATKVSALAVTKKGAQSSLPTAREVEKFFRV